MSTKEEKWSEMGFRRRINTLNAPLQPVLMMVMSRRPHTMALGKGVHSCSGKEVGDEEGWPGKSKKMVAG